MIESAQLLIQESLKEQKMLYAQDRRHMIYKLLDYYAGDNTAQYIEDRFGADAFREIPVSEFNVTRRMIDRMSRIYTTGATRNVNDVYDSMIKNKPHKLKHMEKMTRLLGTIATQVVIKQSPDPHFNYNPVYFFDAYFIIVVSFLGSIKLVWASPVLMSTCHTPEHHTVFSNISMLGHQ